MEAVIHSKWSTNIGDYKIWNGSRGGFVPSTRYLMFFLCLCLLLDMSRQQEQQQQDHAGGEEEDDDKTDYATLADWMVSHGGIVDPRMTLMLIDNKDSDDGSQHRGMIARKDIPEGTTLVGCPFELILGFRRPWDERCSFLPTIEHELRLGKESFWYPYLSLLQQQLDKDNSNDSSSSCRMPNLWNSAALHELHQVLPPSIEDATRHTRWAEHGCGYQIKKSFQIKKRAGSTNDEEIVDEIDFVRLQALIIKITRAGDRGLVPIYDLFNHHNGELNTHIEIDAEEERFLLVASRPVPKGMELFSSYGAHWVPSMFRDYGFIEQWPQVWHWGGIDDGTGSIVAAHSFMVLPPPSEDDSGKNHDDNTVATVAIGLSEELIDDIGMRYVPLSEYHKRVRIHNMAVIGEDNLIDFQRAAYELLFDQRGVTSINDDESYLGILRTRIQNLSNNIQQTTDDDITFLKDVTCAVEYRLEFKKAVKKALTTVTNILEIKKRMLHTEL